MPTRAERLSREDWIQKATETLVESGLGAIRVEPLAKDLGVTKGSFYWHFADHQALLDAIVASWEAGARERIEQIRTRAPDPASRLRFLLDMVSGGSHARMDLAMRGWSMHDTALAERMRSVDRDRLSMMSAIFRELGFDEATARTRARLVYQALLGEPAVFERGDDDQRRRVIDAIFGFVTQRP